LQGFSSQGLIYKNLIYGVLIPGIREGWTMERKIIIISLSARMNNYESAGLI